MRGIVCKYDPRTIEWSVSNIERGKFFVYADLNGAHLIKMFSLLEIENYSAPFQMFWGNLIWMQQQLLYEIDDVLQKKRS